MEKMGNGVHSCPAFIACSQSSVLARHGCAGCIGSFFIVVGLSLVRAMYIDDISTFKPTEETKRSENGNVNGSVPRKMTFF
jgi:hypothetical protein